jgi:fungal STAND N-terminal Goodbye domain
MPSTGQASSTSNTQLIIDSFADYAQITGIDLCQNSFVATLEQSTSLEAILQQLQRWEKAFEEYCDGDRRLSSYLIPVVKVLQAFSGVPGDGISLVSYMYYLSSF